MRRTLLSCLLAIVLSYSSGAQCTTANVNWDNLDFLVNTGNYASFVTAAQTSDQNFAFGPASLRVKATANITINGENTSHTGEGGAYGTGADASFATTTTVGVSTITLSFASSALTALRFSLFDIDNNQKVTITALNGVAAVSTTLSKANTSSAVTFTGSPGLAPVINGTSGDYGASDNMGAVNIDVAGPVTSVVLTFSNATGDFWLSDFQACVPGSFPTDYHQVSKPWPGQPSYVLATPDNNSVYAVNPSTGAAKQLFSEPEAMYVNGMGYNPYEKKLFYALDDTVSGVVRKKLKVYDFDNETQSTVVSDVSSWGIPLFDGGIESASASFYGGCLYLGIEGGNPASTSNRESIIWRIQLDASYNPVNICQVFAVPADNGSGTKSHDWGDFVIKDGVLYDWDSGNSGGSQQNIYHYNLQTQVITNTYSGGSIPFAVSQVATTWNGTLYQIRNYIVQYNNAGNYTGAYPTISGAAWSGSAGDAAEAFKPKADFGDAPATYDPAASPAVHELDSNLRLGNTFDREWLKEGASAAADADGGDEDGIASVPILCPCSGNFLINVKVYNNTGANATLIGWLDYNGNGVFDAGESVSATVSPGAAVQNINLAWTTALTYLPNLSTTFLRVRLTSAANAMTSANASGYFANGEVEDYRVYVVGFVLDVNLQSFTAAKTANDDVTLAWQANEQATLRHYAIQRSSNRRDWTDLGVQQASGRSTLAQYSFTDVLPRSATTYYRLQMTNTDGSVKVSEVRQVSDGPNATLVLWPNPAHKQTSLRVNASAAATADVQVVKTSGAVVYRKNVKLAKGSNVIDIDVSSLPAGIYRVRLVTGGKAVVQTLVKE